MKKKSIGKILLVEHSGKPTEWPVYKAGNDDMKSLLEVFDRVLMMCTYELAMGGTLRLIDSTGKTIREQRGRVT